MDLSLCISTSWVVYSVRCLFICFASVSFFLTLVVFFAYILNQFVFLRVASVCKMCFGTVLSGLWLFPALTVSIQQKVPAERE